MQLLKGSRTKREREDTITITMASVWVAVAGWLFLHEVAALVSDYLLANLGEAWSSIYQRPIDILMLFFYLGGFYVFYEGAKQLVTGEKPSPGTR